MKKVIVFLAVLAGCVSENSLDEFHQVSRDKIHLRNLRSDEPPRKVLGTDSTAWGFEFVAGSDGVLELVVHDRVGTIPIKANFLDDADLKDKVIVARQVRMEANQMVTVLFGSDQKSTVMVTAVKTTRGVLQTRRNGISETSQPTVSVGPSYAGPFNLDQGEKEFSVAEANSVVSLCSWGWLGRLGGIGPERGDGSTVTLRIDDEKGVALYDHVAPVWVLRMKYIPDPR